MRRSSLLLILGVLASVRIGQAQEIDLTEAVRRGLVTASGQGLGDFETMTLQVTAKEQTVGIVIRAGTFFTTECYRSNRNNRQQQENCSQPLVVLVTARVRINANAAVRVDLKTACADFDLHIPKENESFQLDEAGSELLKLVRCMEEKSLDDSLRQLAVWIVTNDFGEVYDEQWITTLRLFFESCGISTSRRIFSTNSGTPEYSLFLPIVLSSSGLNNAFFTSELTLTNRSERLATVSFRYTAAFGEGSGTAMDVLAPREQRIIPDALDYLRAIGVPLPESGNRGGTLAVTFFGVAAGEGSVAVRTTTAVAQGRAGLAYAGVPTTLALTEPSYICGLRQNGNDRSNVAIQNAGSASQGDIVLRLTVFSGDPNAPFSQILPDEVLSPGAFKQISGILASNGLSVANGYVRIQRVSGAAPYYAYGVINDQANSDGSFVPPALESSVTGRTQQTLPVIVETNTFSSEIVLTNWSASAKTLRLRFISDSLATPGKVASFTLTVRPGEQTLIPDFIGYLRRNRVAGLEASGTAYAGALFASVDTGDMSGIFLGARTAAPGGGGRYGLFYPGVPERSASSTSAWLYGLQQNGESRTNLALVNTGENGDGIDAFRIEVYDGYTGAKVSTLEDVQLEAGRWLQFGNFLAQYAPGSTQGYAHITRTRGSNPFIAYAIINDGANAGERTGDGAFVASQP